MRTEYVCFVLQLQVPKRICCCCNYSLSYILYHPSFIYYYIFKKRGYSYCIKLICLSHWIIQRNWIIIRDDCEMKSSLWSPVLPCHVGSLVLINPCKSKETPLCLSVTLYAFSDARLTIHHVLKISAVIFLITLAAVSWRVLPLPNWLECSERGSRMENKNAILIEVRFAIGAGWLWVFI